MSEELTQTLLDLERRGWDSLCDGTGDRFYGSIMTEDAVMVLANGMVMDRDTVVAALGQSPPWRAYELADERLVPAGPDAAALVYTGTAYGEAEEPAFVGAMTSVYVRSGDDWQLAVYQQTERPGG